MGKKFSDIKIEMPYRWFVFSRKLVSDDKIEGLHYSIPKNPNGIMVGKYKGLELIENDFFYEYKSGKVFKSRGLIEKAIQENYEKLESLWIRTDGYIDWLSDKQ